MRFVVDGVTYQLDGAVQVFGDLAGVPFKCTAIAKRVGA
ncbi:hypothetical protein BN977_01192 [Mycolicibacterium cosmeticum]|uniref:Uncharacterized protein n=1 Tax=Mycolicibacterium cosmeticum TaxID=258533 RepID=W9AL02_MYCCO|nr:hypothetical protein BN977_01192 [Mycolicibacterium cosmeticum]